MLDTVGLSLVVMNKTSKIKSWCSATDPRKRCNSYQCLSKWKKYKRNITTFVETLDWITFKATENCSLVYLILAKWCDFVTCKFHN